MSLKEIKNDLISEAELLIYQMRAAHINSDFGAINLTADSLSRVCKKLDMIRAEEERVSKALGL